MRSHCARATNIAGALSVLIVNAPTCVGGVRSMVVEVVDAGTVEVGAREGSCDRRAAGRAGCVAAQLAVMTSIDSAAAHHRARNMRQVTARR
jgi:hypothetical protein